jgi:hypothetical protein
MLPSRDQIERAAYDRWERRGRFHGADREDWVAAEMDLTFNLNYKTVVEYSLCEPKPRILGDEKRPKCRFCEQGPPQAAFSVVRFAVPEVVGNKSLKTREICDECAEQFTGSLDTEFAKFWESLEPLRCAANSFRELRVPTSITIPAYKSLVRMALAIMPESELSTFTDTIEWVANPDHDFDRKLFEGAGSLIYRTHIPYASGWTSLAQRIEDDAPYPFMQYFLAVDRLVVQIHLPLCGRDEDLDGLDVRSLERSFSTGLGSDYQSSTCMVMPLKAVAEQSRPRRFRLFW